MIKRLFFGDFYKIKGLFQHLRDIDHMILPASTLVIFLSELLDFRKNHHAKFFIDIFA